jgi:D-alanyl-D-alanine carboxypeptidase
MLAWTPRLAAVALAVTLSLSPAHAGGPALLFDSSDGRVLYAEDADNQWHPASLTKIMTAYITFEAIKEGKLQLDTPITCSELASSQGPTKVGLPPGGSMTIETALAALIVKSANDVAVMLAEAISGSHEAFVARMNATAVRLGMTRTRFANANGLPAPEQVTTARDLARLSAAVVREYPQYAHMWSLLEAKVGKRRLRSHNGLLTNYEGADGIKTGFICDSGYNVVASATRDGRKLIAVVLGERTGGERMVRAANLLELGFQTQAWKSLFAPSTLDSMPIAENAKGAVTIRQTVKSFVCGTGGRRAVARAKKRKGQAGSDQQAGGTAPVAKKSARKASAAPATKSQN